MAPVHGVGVGRALGLEHVVGPLEQLGPVGRGHAEHVADHGDGQRRRDVGHEVALALLAHLVDDGVARRRGPGPPWPAPAWA